MRCGLLIDIGSTFTKTVAVDLRNEEIIGKSQSPTTVTENVMIGIEKAINGLNLSVDFDFRLACSSAAGGLRMIVIGLVPDLTTEAAKRSALGAGAKVVGVYSFELSREEVDSIVSQKPDIILLTGGTDGGNSRVILKNGRSLAKSPISCPIIVAGNKVVAKEVELVLKRNGKDAIAVANVMPELGILNVVEAQNQIRKVFMERIVLAKGLERAMEIVDEIIMPTPLAVLKAAALLADGTDKEAGMGDLIVLDIGGATTDVHSVADGYPTGPGVVMKGLPERRIKRTVEGDLGIRYNSKTILQLVGEQRLKELLDHTAGDSVDLAHRVEELSRHVDFVPTDIASAHVDKALARAAAEVAMVRHAGRLESVYTPGGLVTLQYGKDLTDVKTVIGTGGIFVNNPYMGDIFAGCLYNQKSPQSLLPRRLNCLVDEQYVLFAVGLLESMDREAALRLAKTCLKPILSDNSFSGSEITDYRSLV
jgi:uncharacterized protein (TIGR01319 family)